jgi:glycosyltransferase involved in cell wall biosynthesis
MQRKQKKIITFICNKISMGGLEKMVKFVANSCVDVYDEVYLLSIFESENFMPIKSEINIIKMRIKEDWLGSNKNKIKSFYHHLLVMIKLRKIIRNINPQIVCAFGSDVAFITRTALLGVNTKVIASERGDPNSYNKKTKIFTQFAYSRCDGLSFQTVGARNYFSKKIQEKSVVIPNPYYPRDDKQIPFEGERKKTIVAAGRFVEPKGFDLLIKAFSIVKQSFPEYKLRIYGDGPCQDDYLELIKKLNLSDSVSFPGKVLNLSGAIREDGVFVLPSRALEGIPNVIIDAMTIGVPVVATDCSPGGPAMLTDNGKRGVLVSLNDIEALSKGIIKVISDPLYAKHISKEGLVLREELNKEKIANLRNLFNISK